MYKYIIEGSFPIKGRIKSSGNKNAALPCLAATLLTDEEVVLKNLPDIEDVRVMVDILKDLGSSVKKSGKHEYRIKTNNIKKETISPELSQEIRASILFAGPLLARVGKVVMPPPGRGCYRQKETGYPLPGP